MNILAPVVYAVVFLTLAIIGMSIFALAARLLGDLRESRIRRLRARIREAIEQMLAGPADSDVSAEIARNRELALDVIVAVSSGLDRTSRAPLRELSGTFDFAPQEVAALGSRRWPVRMRAATRLAYIGDHRAVPALRNALRDEMLDVRLAAARALAELESVESVVPILQALALPAAWPLQRCTEILYAMGVLAIDPLLAFVADEGADRSDAALSVCVKVLGMLRVRRAAPLVEPLLRHANPELRLTAATALGAIGETGVILELCATLQDRAWEVRCAAAKALGELRDSAAVPSLHERLADPAWWVRCNAAESLFRIGPAGRRALEHAMASHRDPFARDIARQTLEEHGAMPSFRALSA